MWCIQLVIVKQTRALPGSMAKEYEDEFYKQLNRNF